jgi:hypothetical protein
VVAIAEIKMTSGRRGLTKNEDDVASSSKCPRSGLTIAVPALPSELTSEDDDDPPPPVPRFPDEFLLSMSSSSAGAGFDRGSASAELEMAAVTTVVVVVVVVEFSAFETAGRPPNRSSEPSILGVGMLELSQRTSLLGISYTSTVRLTSTGNSVSE